MSRLSVPAIVTATFFVPIAAAQAAEMPLDCPCYGEQLAHFKGGGGSSPLSWVFEAYLQRPGGPTSQPLLCYLKSVENNSRLEVRNVYWEVAGYNRRSIPAGRSNISCPVITGQIQSMPQTGPLYFGITSDALDTTVQQPQNGWKVSQVAGPSFYEPPMRSTFGVSVTDRTEAVITIYSSVTIVDKRNILNYEFANHGNAPVFLLVNLPVTPLIEKVPFFSNDTIILPGQQVAFRSLMEQAVVAHRATIAITSPETKQTLAVETAGLYGPSDGKRPFIDNDLYNRLR